MKTIILLHGALGSKDDLQQLQQSLEGYYHVHAINFPGHGGDESKQAFSIPAFADFVNEYMSHQQISSASFFGYSMGGYVAFYLAKLHPEKVENIVTLGTKFHWDNETAAREIKMLQPELIEQKIPAFAKALQEKHAPADWKEMMQSTADMMKSLGAKNSLQAEDYKSISQPSLLLLGDRDKMVSLEETVAVYKALPQGQLAILPDTVHALDKVDNDLLLFYTGRFFA